MLTALFLLFTFISLGAESDDDESDESDDDGSGSMLTFGPCFLQFYVELFSDRVIISRVSIFLIFSCSLIFSIFCSSL